MYTLSARQILVIALISGLFAAGAIAVVDRLEEVGVKVERENGTIFVSSQRRINPVEMTTQPYPGFPTDLQAQLMALLCLGDGMSVITERVFPDRFTHVGELNRMGGRVRKEGSTAVVQGVKEMQGAPVMASDLRASAALVLAGLVAKGETRVDRVYHIDRGYEKIEQKLMDEGKIPHVSWERIIDHIDHAVKLVGAEHVGLGSDFDGANMPEGLEDASKLPKITEALLRKGYSEADIRKILGENTLRVLEQAEKVSGELQSQQ